jgi:spoIIIJ-associated protein
MPDSVEVRARTKEDAIRQALDQLGVTRDDVEIEVLEEGRSGVFGVGSQDARVRVTLIEEAYEDDDEDEDRGNRFTPGELAARVEPDEEEEGYEDDGEDYADEEYPEEEYEEEEGAEEEEEAVVFNEADAETARATLEQMLDLLEFPNVVTVSRVQQDGHITNIHLDVAAEDVGLLIGRRGETLTNLQFLLNACLSGQLGRSTRVIVDVEHYRDRREQSLRGIAMRAADRARREHRPVTLAPMPPNERRIIHLTLQASPYVSTESTGEGPERRVVVSPKGGASPRRPNYGYRRG